jgi:hypothetical protein
MSTTPTTPAPAATPVAPVRTISILSLVAAIASIPLGHLFVLPIAAIVLGFIARTREPAGRSLSTWGIVVGFVLLFWWVIVGAIAASFWFPLAIIHHIF